MANHPVDPTKALTKHCKSLKIRVLHFPRTTNRDLGKFQCHCGGQYEATAKYVLTHFGCRECTRNQWKAKLRAHNLGKTPANKKSHAAFVAELKAANPQMKCLDKYNGAFTALRFKCLRCGVTTTRLPINAVRFGCSSCSGNLRKTVESYNEELCKKKIHFQVYEYKGARVNVEHTCTICKKVSISAPPTNGSRIGKLACPICDSNTIWAVEAPGKVFRVRGYERFALPKMLRVYKPGDIVEDLSGKVPRVPYEGGEHRPDFYIPKKNLLIEIKSLTTLGLTGATLGHSTPAQTYRACRNKKKAAVQAGFKYLLALFAGNGKRIPLPANWEDYSRSALIEHISSLGFRC